MSEIILYSILSGAAGGILGHITAYVRLAYRQGQPFWLLRDEDLYNLGVEPESLSRLRYMLKNRR